MITKLDVAINDKDANIQLTDEVNKKLALLKDIRERLNTGETFPEYDEAFLAELKDLDLSHVRISLMQDANNSIWLHIRN